MREFTAEKMHFGELHIPGDRVDNPSTMKGIVDRLTTVFLVLIVLMAGSTVGIQLADLQYQGQSTTLSLGEVQAPSDTPLFMVESAPDARYLRGAVGIVYDGTDWRLKKAESDGQDLNIRLSRDTLPLHPVAQGQMYSDYDRDVLNGAASVTGNEYTKLPNNISDRVKELSLEITDGFDTPFEKARAIEVFLKVNYDYKLGFSPAPSDWEPNDWFLFEAEEGICGNFSSAFVVLARASDIPARLAAGYFVKSGEGEQIVYERQAHAWAEVGFEDLGWLVFDAT